MEQGRALGLPPCRPPHLSLSNVSRNSLPVAREPPAHPSPPGPHALSLSGSPRWAAAPAAVISSAPRGLCGSPSRAGAAPRAGATHLLEGGPRGRQGWFMDCGRGSREPSGRGTPLPTAASMPLPFAGLGGSKPRKLVNEKHSFFCFFFFFLN